MRDLIARLMPEGARRRLAGSLAYAGLRMDPDWFVASVSGVSLAASLAVAFAASGFGVSFIGAFALSELVVLVGVYGYVTLAAEGRARFVESVLPDALRLMASNIKSGLTTEQALMYSSRPEFGFFREELIGASSRMMSGDTFEEALVATKSSFKSEDYSAAVDLIVQGVRSGGRLSDSLERMSDLIREREFVKKEIRAGVQMYVSLIMFAILVGAPLLFGISSFLIQVLQAMSGKLAAGASGMGSAMGSYGSVLAAPGGLPVSAGFIVRFSLVCIVSNALLGSVVISLISSGGWRGGLRIMPFFVIASVAVFMVVKEALALTLGSMMG